MTDAEFEGFYKKHKDYVYRICLMYMKHKADAEDCAEDVFVRALTLRPHFNDDSHERRWLAVVASNHCKNKLKQKNRTEQLEDNCIAAADDTELDNVRLAVMSLPAKYKDVVWLYYYEGYKTEEIAKILKRPASTVRNQLKDARDILAKLLK